MVAALAAETPELLEPIAARLPVLGVELAFALGSELALTTEDLLDRRTRLGLVPDERARALGAAEALITGRNHVAA